MSTPHTTKQSNGTKVPVAMASKDKKHTKTKPNSEATEGASDSNSDSEILDSGSESSAPKSNNKAASKIAHAKLQPSRSLEVTLFDRLEKMYGGSRIKRMLNVQYR